MSQEIVSEIFEYRAMYTKNVTQKLKAWVDGKATFYKYNKKLQIHNEDGHMVADVFFRNIQMLEEERWGEEFKVGGVLVMIEELISEGRRNIGQVFKKQKLDPTTSRAPHVKIPPVIHKTPTPLKTHSTTPVSLGSTIRRRKVGLSRLETPSKRARPSQKSQEQPSPPQTSSSPEKETANTRPRIAPRVKRPTLKVKTEFKEPPATKDTETLQLPEQQTTHIVPKTPAVAKHSAQSALGRATPSACTPVPLSKRVQQTPASTEKTPDPLLSATKKPSALLQKLLEEDDPCPVKSTEETIIKPIPSPAQRRVTPPTVPKIIIKPEPEDKPEAKESEHGGSLDVQISWGTQDNTSELAARLATLHRQERGQPPQIQLPVTTPAPRRPLLLSARNSSNNMSTTPRPRIGRAGAAARETIRVEQPTPMRTPSTRDSEHTGRTPLQALQKNSLLKVAQRFETPNDPGQRKDRLKLQGGLVTPASARSKINVYMSESEDDEIEETQIPRKKESGKVTQTETYNYGGEGHRVSNLRF